MRITENHERKKITQTILMVRKEIEILTLKIEQDRTGLRDAFN